MGFELQIFHSSGRRLNHKANETVVANAHETTYIVPIMFRYVLWKADVSKIIDENM